MRDFTSRSVRRLAAQALGAVIIGTVLAASLQAQSDKKLLPLKYVGPPTVPAITAGDLMTRLYKYADDSMMGRDVGTVYHLKAAAYIEGELRKMGLKPGGTNGSFYQDFPLWSTQIDPASSLTINGRAIANGKDLLILPGGPIAWQNIPMVWGGMPIDTMTSLDSAAVAGKILVVNYFPQGMPTATMDAYRASASYKAYRRAVAGAAGRVYLQVDGLPAEMVAFYTGEAVTMEKPEMGGQQQDIYLTPASVEMIFGAPPQTLTRGTVSAPISLKGSFVTKVGNPGRNVVAILPGSDPVLKNQYVAIGAHSDHIGFSGLGGQPNEHDSLRIFNRIGIPAGAEGGRDMLANPITPAEWTQINAEIADLRKSYPARQDSIANGADDDGSGTVSVLEIAEAFAKGTIKPKRSLLFVWHAGEEHGMWGSGYFMDHPTVPRDSIVAQLNVDMVGRGAAADVTGQSKAPDGKVEGTILHGGDHYVQLVGSRRLSTELGDLVEKVNISKKHGFNFDYAIDANGHQQNIYCRSDHWSYAKWGVPVVFFTTGGHADYHQVTDEPQYIRYDHMASIDKLIFDIATNVANLGHRVVVDKPKPKTLPVMECKQ